MSSTLTLSFYLAISISSFYLDLFEFFLRLLMSVQLMLQVVNSVVASINNNATCLLN